jgi:hypothetical protein
MVLSDRQLTEGWGFRGRGEGRDCVGYTRNVGGAEYPQLVRARNYYSNVVCSIRCLFMQVYNSNSFLTLKYCLLLPT